jgi:hypothetical protein
MYDFKTFTFGTGSHKSRKDGMCLMEAVAYVAGEKHSDRPKCACPVISAFLRSWNDAIPNDDRRRELLEPFVFRMVGTKTTAATEEQRSFMCLDWLVRVHTPAFIDLAPVLQPHAVNLRSLSPITDIEAAIAAGETVRAVWADVWAAAGSAARAAARAAVWDSACAAAGAAVWAAAGAAAWAAAGTAAWDAAARAAARAAVWDSAWAAAGAAVWAAVGDSAEAALNTTVEDLQVSASCLVDRMIRLTEPQEVVRIDRDCLACSS